MRQPSMAGRESQTTGAPRAPCRTGCDGHPAPQPRRRCPRRSGSARPPAPCPAAAASGSGTRSSGAARSRGREGREVRYVRRSKGRSRRSPGRRQSSGVCVHTRSRPRPARPLDVRPLRTGSSNAARTPRGSRPTLDRSGSGTASAGTASRVGRRRGRPVQPQRVLVPPPVVAYPCIALKDPKPAPIQVVTRRQAGLARRL